MDTLTKSEYNGFIALAQEHLRYAMKPAKNGSPIAYSYLRFSSPAQADGDSLRRQNALRDAWLKQHPDVRLDKTLRLEDRGVSGYTGKHRTDERHALGHFLRIVQEHRVIPGSFLIVENLDRLTRENPIVSIPAVLNLIAAGIRVVQLAPYELIYDADMDQHHLMAMLWELSRGHGESKRKSGLCESAWLEKKTKARMGKVPHGRMCPAWLELVNDHYRLKADAAATIRKIFEWCANGLGTFGILGRMNREGVPCFGRKRKWGRSYLQKILGNRAVLGEYQPHRGSRGPSRKPEGETIPDYYPRVIDDAIWYAAHEAIRKRARRTGRPPTASNNPFSGLLNDAIDGAKLHVMGTSGPKYRYLVSSSAVEKISGSKWRTFPLAAMVDGLVSLLEELSASSLFSDPGAERITELSGRLSDVEKRLAVALARFEDDPESPTWSTKVSQYDREKRSLVSELKEAEMEAQHPLSALWSEALERMRKDDPLRLRASLLETIETIPCIIVARGKTRIAAAQVWFRSGKVRSYLIVHKGGTAGAVGKKAAQRWCDSLASAAASDDLDLRRPEDAEALAEVLAEMDLSEFCTERRKF